ncbi:hypothetical protein A2U01_0050757, partial [Trifolium medium]|nr:hypothetical protein [Trifolium medium]
MPGKSMLYTSAELAFSSDDAVDQGGISIDTSMLSGKYVYKHKDGYGS